LKTLASNDKKCVWESALRIKSYVSGSLFTLRTCKLFSRRGKSFSRILVQLPHEISTTMFVLIKNLNFIVEYVQGEFYFSNVGWTNSLILLRTIAYILSTRLTQLASLSILVLFIVLLLSLVQLIRSNNFHHDNTQTYLKKFHDWQKKLSSFALAIDTFQ